MGTPRDTPAERPGKARGIAVGMAFLVVLKGNSRHGDVLGYPSRPLGERLGIVQERIGEPQASPLKSQERAWGFPNRLFGKHRDTSLGMRTKLPAGLFPKC